MNKPVARGSFALTLTPPRRTSVADRVRALESVCDIAPNAHALLCALAPFPLRGRADVVGITPDLWGCTRYTRGDVFLTAAREHAFTLPPSWAIPELVLAAATNEHGVVLQPGGFVLLCAQECVLLLERTSGYRLTDVPLTLRIVGDLRDEWHPTSPWALACRTAVRR